MDDRYLGAEVTQNANARADALALAVQLELRNRVVIQLLDAGDRSDRAHDRPVHAAVQVPAGCGGAVERLAVQPLAPDLDAAAGHAEIQAREHRAAFGKERRLVRI